MYYYIYKDYLYIMIFRLYFFRVYFFSVLVLYFLFKFGKWHLVVDLNSSLVFVFQGIFDVPFDVWVKFWTDLAFFFP